MFFDFKNLIKYLRDNGISSHFTIGGHFPTIKYADTLELIPELDSVITHEGELTLLELFSKIESSEDWCGIKGIACRKDGKTVYSGPRPLIVNLDCLPFPLRGGRRQRYRGIACCSIIASRGCYYNCSFCSVRQFYFGAPGQRRRTRTASNIAEEVEQLYKKNVKIFKFVDDDLGMKTKVHKTWITDFARELDKRKIGDKILWRISNRVDEFDLECLRMLREVGLTFIYMGIESGNNFGLRTCNKHYYVKDILNALDLLNTAEMKFDYGFMLLTPDSTFDSIAEDLQFLNRLTLNGQALVHFTKMFPYVGTSIAERLKIEGRLEGTIDYPTYRFIDHRVDLMEAFLVKTFHEAFFGHSSIVNKLRMAYFDVEVIRKFYPEKFDLSDYENKVRKIIIEYNESALETINIALNFMRNHSYDDILYFWSTLEYLTRQEIGAQSLSSEKIKNLSPEPIKN